MPYDVSTRTILRNIMRSVARVTPMTFEGVGDPSRLSAKGAQDHYTNRNPPRVLQAINRRRRAAGLKPIMKSSGEEY